MTHGLGSSPSGSRRCFLARSGHLAALGVLAGVGLPGCAGGSSRKAAAPAQAASLAEQAQALMAPGHSPGLSVASVAAGRGVAASAWGWADLERREPMRADTLLNIASVTKTITATALMQQHERGRFQLDDAIDRHLPFKVRNPRFPDAPITFKQLLTHTSSIGDGPAYGNSYACGDAALDLGPWLAAYFTPGGTNHDAQKNFEDWAPGQEWDYSNVAFGLIGHLVETLSGQSYGDYCRDHIFRPLGMRASGIHIRDIDPARHATNYRFAPAGAVPDHPLRGTPPRPPVALQQPPGEQAVPLCLYGFATPPDGGARTSAEELGRFAQAYLQDGELEGHQLLRPQTVRLIHTVHYANGKGLKQGLAWFGAEVPGGMRWDHSGGDPGTSTYLVLDTASRRGAVLLSNGRLGDERDALAQALLTQR